MAKAPTKKTETKATKAPATKEKVTAKAEPKAEAKKVAAKAKPKAAAKPREAKSRCGGKTCQIQNCQGEYKAKGYCRKHYKAWRQGEYGVARYKTCGETCRKPKALNRHGFCEEHYQNYFVKGMEAPKAAPAEKPAEKAAESAA